METRVTDFKSITLKLASPEKILSWSYGEVTKPETINYRTQRAERNGLFDERIFGPEKDYECYCGKYRKIRYKGVICEKCGVEVTRSIVRRERMGHITLASPVSHIWFLRGIPSRIGLILDLTMADVEKVIYFTGYIVTKVNDELKARAYKNVEAEYKSKLKALGPKDSKEDLKAAFQRTKDELESVSLYKVLSEPEYYHLSLKYGDIFEVGIGAESIHNIFKSLNLDALYKTLGEKLETASTQEKLKLLKRVNLLRSMKTSGVRPEWMFLSVIPVIPPALRPMVALEGGRHATSDVNDLYRRVINRNNRLKKLMEIKAPEVICRNEKRILQEAVDALIDNSIRHGQNVATSQAQRRPLKSLADMLKGKHGRFRQNLLGKRVDYSGRSVIVVGPELKMNQCGLPKHMALELFKPFVISKLLKNEMAYNIRGAGRLIEEGIPEVWAILEEVIKNRYVLLNRAPTLHRLGIQAFQPLLIEGNAIQLHPLVTTAFNADFDGDQMAVHVPLSSEAQKEAKEIIASVNNLLRPGNGDPIVNPTREIIVGCFWMTKVKEKAKGEGKYFSSPNEAILAYDFRQVNLRALVKVMGSNIQKYDSAGESRIFETTVGRLLFNSIFPDDFEYVNEEQNKKGLENLVARLIEKYGSSVMPEILDKMKVFGFRYATRSGISWGIDDLQVPKEKPEIIKSAEKEMEKVESNYEEGLLTRPERYNKVIEIWQNAKNKIEALVPKTLDKTASVHEMVSSGARGTWAQVGQMSGMKGLMVNPSGKIIDFPVLASYKEGLSVLQYFITTHGARKGEADTALKTAKAGYLTRRLVNVADDIVVVEDDCGEENGIEILREQIEAYGKKFSARIEGRVLAKDVLSLKKGSLLTMQNARAIESAEGVSRVRIYSPISCKSFRGICAKCYGYDLGNKQRVKIGEAVGVVAAQAIGEPGTQLTLRTFHTGGIAAGGDITMGLPRIEEIFELRNIKNPAVISEYDGAIMGIKETREEREVAILLSNPSKEKTETKEYPIAFGRTIVVKKGEAVHRGDLLTDGSVDIKNYFAIAGKEKAEDYILNEVGKVYSMQGATINDKHLEVIIRKMFSRYRIKDEGDTKFNRGDIVDEMELKEENDLVRKSGKKEAKTIQLVLPISKVSLYTSSFLSAASFQDTTRVLIRTALSGGEDKLRGIRENVIIGRLIPAGTGFVERGKGKDEEGE